MSTTTSRAGESAAAELWASLPGGVALPSDRSYGAACRVWNGAVRRSPAVIALCERAEDVALAVGAARRHGLPLSVHGGGHDWAGRAMRQDGLAIDLTRMRSVHVDPRARVATVAGGARIKDVVAAAAAYGLVAVTGNCNAVGMAGLTLGGGYGLLGPRHGLAADNLLGAEVVLADGQLVATGPEEHPDLFWALRGGGGNFGVVTSMRIRLHERRDLLGGQIVYPLDEAEGVLHRYGVLAASAPDELGVLAVLASGPDGRPAMLLAPLWNGDGPRGERIMGELQALGTPQFAQAGPMAYPDVLAQFDAHTADDGRHWELRTRWLPEIAPGAAAAIAVAVSRKTSFHSAVILHHFRGAAARVAPDATAFGMRREHFMVEIIAAWEPDGGDGADHRRWARDLWQDLAPFALPGGYANLLGPEDLGQAVDAFGGNAARLRSIKRRVDPDNVFASAIPLPGG